jgi:D-alanyl-D-alanine dipeptidase
LHHLAIEVDLRYATTNNLTGQVLPGYLKNKLMGSAEMLRALDSAAEEAAKMGCGMLVFDAYRPQKAVDFLAAWAKTPNIDTKPLYYPNEAKSKLFAHGYIAEKSAHSRGSAVDLTLTRNGVPLDMGSGFDLMDRLSHHGAEGITKEQAENRLLLKTLMERHGFVAYECEWWHYRLIHEPHPDTYFDHDII